MRRNLLAILSSALLLSACIFVWSDLYFFAKSVRLPTWTAIFPRPINTPAYLALLCLLPAAFVPSTWASAARAIALTILVAPLPAIAVYVTNVSVSGIALLLDTLFNYGFVVAFHCFVPAAILLALRVVARLVKERAGG